MPGIAWPVATQPIWCRRVGPQPRCVTGSSRSWRDDLPPSTNRIHEPPGYAPEGSAEGRVGEFGEARAARVACECVVAARRICTQVDAGGQCGVALSGREGSPRSPSYSAMNESDSVG